MCVRVRVCVCMEYLRKSVCVRREEVRQSCAICFLCVCVHVSACVCVHVFACVCACVMCAYVRVREESMTGWRGATRLEPSTHRIELFW